MGKERLQELQARLRRTKLSNAAFERRAAKLESRCTKLMNTSFHGYVTDDNVKTIKLVYDALEDLRVMVIDAEVASRQVDLF